MRTERDFVFVGNLSKGSEIYNMVRGGNEMRSGRLLFGPVMDPHTGEYMPRWQGMRGLYALDTPFGISCIRDREGTKITLERALQTVVLQIIWKTSQ